MTKNFSLLEVSVVTTEKRLVAQKDCEFEE
jgi:hypothetical protein